MRRPSILILTILTTILGACGGSTPPVQHPEGDLASQGSFVGTAPDGTRTLFATGVAHGVAVDEQMARNEAAMDARSSIAAVIRAALLRTIDCDSARERDASSASAAAATNGVTASGSATAVTTSAHETCTQAQSEAVSGILTMVTVPRFQTAYERDTIYAQASVPLSVIVARVEETQRALSARIEVRVNTSSTEANVSAAASVSAP